IVLGEDGNDTIYDGDHNGFLYGDSGDDVIYAGGGDDTLEGGNGNDDLQGDHGNDTYYFKKGYGQDVIYDSSDDNIIKISGFSANEMINTKNANNDLIINFENSEDSLTVKEFFNYNSNRNFTFIFDNGTTLGQYDITAKYAPIYGTENGEWLSASGNDGVEIYGLGGNDGLQGTNGNDILDGGDGNDTLSGNEGSDSLDGGFGNDDLQGGGGNDTYIFGKNYGQDVVNDWGGNSVVIFKDLKSTDVTITSLYGSALVFTVNGTEDKLTINNFKWSQGNYEFQFADGGVGTVDKNTFEMQYSVLPTIPEEVADENVTETLDETIVTETENVVETSDETIVTETENAVEISDENTTTESEISNENLTETTATE
ncbi:MAG: hypothetical protein LBL93_07680, partial [Ruminococcus sp.]|nr:hypothetical protein [Ruminococcus sp.]